MLPTGMINCTALDRVIFGMPAAQAVAEEAERRDARRVPVAAGHIFFFPSVSLTDIELDSTSESPRHIKTC